MHTIESMGAAQEVTIDAMNEEPAASFSPFSSRMHAAILLSPLVFIAVALFDVIANGRSIGKSPYLEPLTELVLLDVTHIFFGFALLAFPEVRSMIRERSGGRPSRLWISMACVFIAAAGAATVVHEMIPAGVYPLLTLQLVFLMIVLHHGVSQTRGISSLYSASLMNGGNLRPDDLTFARKNGLNERKLFSGLLASWLGYHAFEILHAVPSLQTIRTVFDFVEIGLRAATLFFIAGLFVNAYAHWKRFPKSKKFLFLLRLIVMGLLALDVLNIYFDAALASLHGIEYLGIFATTLTNSGQSRSSKSFVLIGVFLACLLAFPLVIAMHWESLSPIFERSGTALAPGLKWLSILLAGFQFSHYFLDRYLYRMRHPAVRNFIAPLLKSSRS